MIIIVLQFNGKVLPVLLVDLNSIMFSLSNSLILLLVWLFPFFKKLFPRAAAITDYRMIA